MENQTTAETLTQEMNKSSAPSDSPKKDSPKNDNIPRPCILNGLLTYVNTVINNSTYDKILKIIVTFYNANDILLAKRIMWQTCDTKIIGNFMSRNNSKARLNSEANAADIIDAMKLLDQNSAIPLFAASATDKLPLRLPEELNLVCISERLSKVEEMITSHASTLVRHNNTMSKMHQFNVHVKDTVLTPIENNMMNINADKKSHDVSKPKCKTPDAKMEKMILKNIEKDKSNTDHAAKPLTRQLTAINDKDITTNDNSTKPKLIPQNLFNNSNIKTYAQSALSAPTESRNRFTNNNNNSIDNGTKMITANNKIFDAEGFETIESKNARKKRLEQLANYNKYHPSNSAQKPTHEQNNLFTGKTDVFTDIWLYRIECGNEDSIYDHLLARGIEIVSIQKVSHNDAELKSFKIRILKADQSKFESGEVLPQGVRMKIWKEPRRITRNHNNNDSSYNRSRYNRYDRYSDRYSRYVRYN